MFKKRKRITENDFINYIETEDNYLDDVDFIYDYINYKKIQVSKLNVYRFIFWILVFVSLSIALLEKYIGYSIL